MKNKGDGFQCFMVRFLFHRNDKIRSNYVYYKKLAVDGVRSMILKKRGVQLPQKKRGKSAMPKAEKYKL